MSLARAVLLPAVILTVTLPRSSRAQQPDDASWSVELFTGSAVNVPTPLTIHQTGFPDIRTTAHYATRPMKSPPYYAVRLGRWVRGRAWELELVHDKLYLENPPPEIQSFEATHGYNLFTVNRAARSRGLILRAGLGVIVIHPEATVRGRGYTNRPGNLWHGYSLTGPTAQLAVEKRFALWRQLVLAVEGKVTGSYARFPAVDGSGIVPNVAVHGLLGLGWGR